MKKIITILIWLLSSVSLMANYLSDSAQVMLLTCAPGDELYARYGHTAIRVSDRENNIDYVFNYGIFDFNTEAFYWKFVRGETYYQLGVDYTAYFYQCYAAENRKIYEQKLRLTPDQKDAIYAALVKNYQPENRFYLYNFVFDNCATRPYQLIKNALGDSIIFAYEGAEGKTYREFIHRYTRPGTWSDFGINLIFGRRSNVKMHGEERLFLPEELMNFLSEAKLSDGTSLIESEDIAPFEIVETKWYENCYVHLALLFVALLLLSVWDSKRGKLTWGVDVALGVVDVLLLIIVVFLTFFSIHPLVGFSWRLLILPCIHLCARIPYLCVKH